MYQHTVKAALRYLEVEDSVVALEQRSEPDPVDLDAAEDQWQKVLLDLGQADIDSRQLPHDLTPRLASLRNKLLDPNTQLPVGKLLRMSLMQRVLNQEELWSLLHIKFTNYGTFEAKYPGEVNDLLQAVANILKKVSEHYREGEPLVGFMDKHPAIGPSFLIILKEEHNHLALKLGAEIEKEFNSLSRRFVSEPDILMSAKERAKKALQEGKTPRSGGAGTCRKGESAYRTIQRRGDVNLNP